MVVTIVLSRNSLISSFVLLHKLGGLKFLNNIIGIVTFYIKLWSDRPEWLNEFKNSWWYCTVSSVFHTVLSDFYCLTSLGIFCKISFLFRSLYRFWVILLPLIKASDHFSSTFSRSGYITSISDSIPVIFKFFQLRSFFPSSVYSWSPKKYLVHLEYYTYLLSASINKSTYQSIFLEIDWQILLFQVKKYY
jgi:hypothetical protein